MKVYEQIIETNFANSFTTPPLEAGRYRITITRLTPSAPKKAWRWAIRQSKFVDNCSITSHMTEYDAFKYVKLIAGEWEIIGKIESTCKEIPATSEDESEGENKYTKHQLESERAEAYKLGNIDGWEAACARAADYLSKSNRLLTGSVVIDTVATLPNPYRP